MKRFPVRVRVFLSAAVAVIWAQTAWAQTWDCGKTPGSVTATFNDGTLTISGTGAMADYEASHAPWFGVNWNNKILNLVIQNGVTSIGNWAFESCSSVKSITIPNSITSIGNYAFIGLHDLESITIPNSVTSIGEGAFVSCEYLTSIVIPNSVTSIASETFYRCVSLTSITIPNSVTSIGAGAFNFCPALKSVVVPNSVASIGGNAFPADCAIEIAPDHPYLVYDDDGVLFNKAKTKLIRCPADKRGAYTIPSGVTSIGDYAFSNSTGLTAVTIPESVTSIGDMAFNKYSHDDNFTHLYAVFCLNPSPPALGENALIFWDDLCLYVPENSIEAYKNNDAWGDFKCIRSVDDEAIQVWQVWDCGKTPGTVTAILGYNGTLTIKGAGDMGFGYYWSDYKKYITNAVIEDGVTSVGNSAFKWCSSLTSVTIPNSVTSIGGGAFIGCTGLTSVTIPNSVTAIGGEAFDQCTGLTSIAIPNSVDSIGDRVFDQCTGLTAITVEADNANYRSEDGVLFNKDGTALIRYPIGKLDTSYTIPESVTSIDTYAFSGCTGLTAVTALNAVPLEIADRTFHSLIVTEARLYVPDGSVEDYHAAHGWEYFAYINDEFVGSVISVAARDRVIPAANSQSNVAVTVPTAKLAAEFAAGPNPANKSSGPVTFFRRGGRIKSASLSVFDAAGGVVNKIIIRDNAAAGGDDRRQVGSWNLKDKKGRIVPDGTYLVRGTITASNGKSEKVSVAVGVR